MAQTSDDIVEEHFLGAIRLSYYTPIRDYPPMADRKATAILAADGLMISVLLLFRPSIEAIVRGANLAMTYLLLTLLASFAALFLIGLVCAYITLTKPIPKMPTSLAFFGDIARRPLDQYRLEMAALSTRESVRAMLDYNFSLAELCVRKFSLVGRAMACVRAEFFVWLALILIAAVQRA